MYIRKASQRKGDVSIDEQLNVDWDGNELLLSDVLGSDSDSVSRRMEQMEDEKAILDALCDLDARERRIIEMRFGMSGSKEYTQKEVADAMGISQSYISRLEKRTIERLRREMTRLLQV
jgi:RNA polymerase sporulation-specific sigma factor